jgi:hypothetical protein
MKKRLIGLFVAGLGASAALAWIAYQWYSGSSSDSNEYIRRWLTDAGSVPQYSVTALTGCADAPFVLPTTGFIGLLWGDTARPYRIANPHTGLDFFGQGGSGQVPIYAVYDGYLTRLADWRSTVIIRHVDPLQPGRSIWSYYTHMANRDGSLSYIAPEFPPGTSELFVEQGRLLGYQGEYNPGFPIAMHLHFSLVTSGADGSFNNEAILANTLDPSPYFGFDTNRSSAQHPVGCQPTAT